MDLGRLIQVDCLILKCSIDKKFWFFDWLKNWLKNSLCRNFPQCFCWLGKKEFYYVDYWILKLFCSLIWHWNKKGPGSNPPFGYIRSLLQNQGHVP